MGAGRIGVYIMTDARYWVTYTARQQYDYGCDTYTSERVADTFECADAVANVFIRRAEYDMDADARITECFVHVYDEVTGTFPVHRTLRRVGRCDGLRWFALDE